MQWYLEEIECLEQQPLTPAGARPRVVFYGSSTFTHWPNMARNFPQVEVINRAFGGSTLAACAWFFGRVVPPHRPDALLLYAGDNDLGDGRTAEEVALFYDHLLASVAAACGPIPVCFVGIKLSPARLYLRDSIARANDYIRQRIAAAGPPHSYLDLGPLMVDERGRPRPALFEADGLHLSAQGYEIWQREISIQLARMLPVTT